MLSLMNVRCDCGLFMPMAIAGVSSIPFSCTSPDQTDVNTIEQIQTSAKNICGFIPMATTISAVLSALKPGLGLASAPILKASDEICKAAETARAVDESRAVAILDGASGVVSESEVPIEGYFTS